MCVGEQREYRKEVRGRLFEFTLSSLCFIPGMAPTISTGVSLVRKLWEQKRTKVLSGRKETIMCCGYSLLRQEGEWEEGDICNR